jgi:hypothetical protein
MPAFVRPLLLAVLVLAPLSSSDATSALYFTDAEQARLSAAVVVATIGTSRQTLHPTWQRPLTFTEVRVDEVLYGSAPPTLEIEQIAGTIDGITTRIPGDALFEEGERCVLFLRRLDGGWYLTSLGQSKYELLIAPDGPMLHRALSISLYARDEAGRLHPIEEPPTKPRTLADLRRSMKSLEQGR